LRRSITAVVLVAATAAGGLTAWRWLSEDDRAGSILLQPGARVVVERTPPAYEIVYRVEDRSATSAERVLISRPFRSRAEVYAGHDPEGELLSVTVTEFGSMTILSGDGVPTTLAAPPQLAVSDLRTDLVLEDAIRDGALQVGERRQVAGRVCQVYRAGGPVNDGTIVPFDDESQTYADVCIDSAGLVLEEVWVSDGDRLRRRVALSVTEDASPDPGLFRLADAEIIPVEQGGGRLRRLEPTSRTKGEFWEMDAPDGFEHDGRFVVVPPQVESFGSAERRPERIALVTDVWTRGIDVVVFDRGGSLGGAPVYEPGAGEVIGGLGEAGDGELIVELRMSEVRVLLATGGFLRVRGTLPADALVELARTLHTVEGDPELRCLSDLLEPEPCG